MSWIGKLATGKSQYPSVTTMKTMKRYREQGKVIKCKVMSVYDGDTITVATPSGDAGGSILMPCRIAGIDTPEMRSKSANEKELAVKARTRLIELLNFHEEDPDKDECVVAITFGKLDKYGRPLVTIRIGQIDVGQSRLSS